MSGWSYGKDPAANEKDAVRFLIGDTDVNDQLLLDAEIEFLLTENGSPQGAAAEAARSIGAKFARLADETVGRVSVKFSQLSKQFFDLSDELRSRADIGCPLPIAGGISRTDKEATVSDDDRVDPAFSRQLHENQRHRLDPIEFINPQTGEGD